MRSWLVRDARAHLSEVIDAALRGEPQRVTRRGKGAVVVVSEEEWTRAAKPKPKMTLGDFLTTYPLSPEDVDLTAARGRDRPPPFVDEEL